MFEQTARGLTNVGIGRALGIAAAASNSPRQCDAQAGMPTT